jgi:spore photoproduct lyase
MKLFHPDIIFIERRGRDYPMAQDILRRLPEVPVREIDFHQNLAAQEFGINRRIALEKRSLVLAVKEGELVKQVERDLFRPTPNEYYIIHSLGCPFDCEYCFLYDYLDHQRPTIFVNLPDILKRIKEIIGAPATATSTIPAPQLFFHAGEFSDALAYDHLTNLSKPLVELFANYQHALLEMRTKSDYVENLVTRT